MRYRTIGINMVAAGLFITALCDGVQAQPLKIHFLEAGYGDAILLEDPEGGHVLIDAGPPEYGPRLAAYLKKYGIERLRAAVVTHPHFNHTGGFKAVLNEVDIAAFYTNGDDRRADPEYEELREILNKNNIPLKVVRRGDLVPTGSRRWRLVVLHPESLQPSVNGSALVLNLVYGDTSFVFFSDIYPRQQTEIMKLYPAIRQADVVQVPHHGGEIDVGFCEFFEDAVFIVSTGLNPYGKPEEKTLQCLNGPVRRTDREGAITFMTDGMRVSIVNATP